MYKNTLMMTLGVLSVVVVNVEKAVRSPRELGAIADVQVRVCGSGLRVRMILGEKVDNSCTDNNAANQRCSLPQLHGCKKKES